MINVNISGFYIYRFKKIVFTRNKNDKVFLMNGKFRFFGGKGF